MKLTLYCHAIIYKSISTCSRKTDTVQNCYCAWQKVMLLFLKQRLHSFAFWS